MRDFHREFFKLAAWMLGCRLRCMGGDVLGSKIPVGDLAFSLLGYIDHAKEMELLCREKLGDIATRNTCTSS